MSIVFGILLVLHLVGWALGLGGAVFGMRSQQLLPGTLHGVLTAVVTGILLVGVAEMSGLDVNHMKIGIKLVVALVVAFLTFFVARRPEKATRGMLGAIAGLIVVNVAIAVLL